VGVKLDPTPRHHVGAALFLAFSKAKHFPYPQNNVVGEFIIFQKTENADAVAFKGMIHIEVLVQGTVDV
jgi:hypothetical protein